MRIMMDIETDGLLENVTKIHCLSYLNIDTEGNDVITLLDYEEMKELLLQDNLEICGHNIVKYDIPVLEKILNIKVGCRLIDTLSLSWYLYPERKKHGLESWGETFSIPKPIIKDWNNLTIEDYIYRCEMDVKINLRLYEEEISYLEEIYGENIKPIVSYLNFKLDCIREQEEVGLDIDVNLIKKSLQELEELKKDKVSILSNAMPNNVKYKEISIPNKMYKKDGSLSTAGINWLKLLEEKNLPEDYNESIQIEISRELGNPGSTDQLKDWLFLLGWEPRTFEFRKNKNGEINKIPQIYENNEVCNSIKDLYEIQPELENLDTLSLINHRIGVLNTFLEYTKNGKTIASVRGFTNTLRFRHSKPIANLVKVGKFYGNKIRGSIIAPENEILCGVDMTALEDTTKQHYMYFFDPEYVKQMRVPGFDPHLDVAVLSGLLTEEEKQFFSWYSNK